MRFLYYLTWVTLLFGCTIKREAKQVIKDALEAHGGIERWEAIKNISYEKTTILYDSIGNIEKHTIQQHHIKFDPDFRAEMNWKEDGVCKKALYIKDSIAVFFDEILQHDHQLEKKYTKDILAANYVFWQPYILYKDTTVLFYEGNQTIQSNQVEVIRAMYTNEDGSSSNTWWYYFDANSHKLVGTTVHHGTTYSYIDNIKSEHETGLFLNAERKSYRVDSLIRIKFLRAHYYYKILEIEY